MGTPKVAGKHNALVGAGDGIRQIDFDIGRAKNMAGTLKASAAVQVLGVLQVNQVL